MTRDRLVSAFSSIDPTLLKTSRLQRSKASRNILVSWFSSSSNAPSPSVSMIIIGVSRSVSVGL